MKNDHPFITNLLMVGVLLEFVTVEAAVAVHVWKHPNPLLPAWIFNAFTVSLVACVPAAAGFRAHSIVRRLQLVGDETFTKVRLSRILLAGIAGAYGVLIMMIVILS